MKLPKRRFIRPGQRHPYRKGTRQQIDERHGFAARMLGDGATKMQIHRAVRQRFNVQWRQCDRYLAFVSGTCKVKTRRLPRARALHCQTSLNDMWTNLKLICGNKGK